MRFRLNDRGVDELLGSAKVERFLEDVGDEVKAEVESQATRFSDSPGFVDSIERTGVEQGPNGPRVTVFSTDIAAHIIEYGSINNTPYAPFRKTAAALGLELKGGGERR